MDALVPDEVQSIVQVGGRISVHLQLLGPAGWWIVASVTNYPYSWIQLIESGSLFSDRGSAEKHGHVLSPI